MGNILAVTCALHARSIFGPSADRTFSWILFAHCLVALRGRPAAPGRPGLSDPDADLPSNTPTSQTDLAMLCNVYRNTFSRVVLTSRRLDTQLQLAHR